MSRIPAIRNRHLWLVRALLLVLFVALAWPSAVLSADDYYALTIGYPIELMTGETSYAIHSLSDIPGALSALYSDHSGRLLLHMAVQLYLRCLGYPALVLTVALLTLWCMEMGARIAFGRPTAPGLLTATGCFVIVMPWFQVGMWWFGNASFALNSCLPAALMLWVLAVATGKFGRLASTSRLPLYLLGALMAGMLHEGYSAATLVILLAILIARRAKPEGRLLWFSAAFWAGTLFVCLSPGNFARTGTEQALGVALHQRWLDLHSVIETAVPPVLLLIWWLVTLARRRTTGGAGLIWWGVAVNFAMCASVVHFRGYSRAFMTAGVLLWLIALILTAIWCRGDAARRVVAGVCAVITGVLGAYWCVVGWQNRRDYDHVHRQMFATRSGWIRNELRRGGWSPVVYADWGPAPAVPWSTCFYADHERFWVMLYRISQGEDGLPAQVRFLPEADRCGWAYIFTGLPGSHYRVETDDFETLALIPRIRKAMGMNVVYPRMSLRSYFLPDSAESFTIVAVRDYRSRIRSVELIDIRSGRVVATASERCPRVALELAE